MPVVTLQATLGRLDRLPADVHGRLSRGLWGVALAALAAGLLCWGFGAYVIALWLLVVCAVSVALVLPMAYALVSPLFMGTLGWLVDMLPLLILVGWAAAVARWAVVLIRQRRMPRGNRWVWLPVFLVVWTALGIVALASGGSLAADGKHFVLLFALQLLISGVVLAAVDCLSNAADRAKVAVGLVAYLVLLSAAVVLQWFGVPIQPLQDSTARVQVEAAYGLDAFPNSVGMIKYTRSESSGVPALRSELQQVTSKAPGFPAYTAFKPRFHAYPNENVVRFEGSARPYAAQLEKHQIHLIFDNVAIAPANTVPRMRSFPRNALTYAGICAVLFPFALYLAFAEEGKRKLLGRAGVAAALFGAGFSLSRGAWVAMALAALYLLVDGLLSRARKAAVVAFFLAGALLLAGVFVLKYGEDPLHARAGGEGSIKTRQSVYSDTFKSVGGLHYAIGYGTEIPRTGSGASHIAGRYVPRAGTHSTYLNYFFRTGVPGTLGILALYIFAFLHARAAARARRDRERMFGVMAAAAMVVVGAHALILSLYVEPAYTLTVSLIVGVAMAGAMSLPASILPWKSQRAGE